MRDSIRVEYVLDNDAWSDEDFDKAQDEDRIFTITKDMIIDLIEQNCKLDKGDYITDQDLYNFCNKEPNYSTFQEYLRKWNRLQADKEFFKNKIIKSKIKCQGKHLLEISGEYFTCGQDYYKTINICHTVAHN